MPPSLPVRASPRPTTWAPMGRSPSTIRTGSTAAGRPCRCCRGRPQKTLPTDAGPIAFGTMPADGIADRYARMAVHTGLHPKRRYPRCSGRDVVAMDASAGRSFSIPPLAAPIGDAAPLPKAGAVPGELAVERQVFRPHRLKPCRSPVGTPTQQVLRAVTATGTATAGRIRRPATLPIPHPIRSRQRAVAVVPGRGCCWSPWRPCWRSCWWVG